MFAFYLAGYAAVAGLVYWRAYKTAPVMEEFDVPLLTLWVNPELAGGEKETEDEIWRKAA